MNLGECATCKPDHYAFDPSVTNNNIRSHAEYGSWNAIGNLTQEIAKVSTIRRQEQHVRRAADAKPGEWRQRLIE